MCLKIAANPVICQNPSSGKIIVKQYYNSGYVPPVLLNVGISSASVQVNGSHLICSFTRQNSNSALNYLNLNGTTPFLIAAYGPLSNGSNISFLF